MRILWNWSAVHSSSSMRCIFQSDYFPLSLFSRQSFVTTVTVVADLPEFKTIYETFPDAPFVSISDHQRRPIPGLNWCAKSVLHGMPDRLLTPQPVPQSYFAFLGRISPERAWTRPSG